MIKNKKKALLISFTAVIVAFFIGTCIFFFDMKNISTDIGQGLGTIVGSFTGSLDGIKKGTQEGEEEGRSAKDTEVKIDDIKSMGVLEVLEVNFTEVDSFGIGSKQDKDGKYKNYKLYYPDYARLFELQGSAVYTIDLAYVEFKDDKNSKDRVNVELPSIKVDTRIKYNTFRDVAEYPINSSGGDTDGGAISFDNSLKELEKKIKEAFIANETLKGSAREAAIKQISSIVEALTNKKVNSVTFKEGE